ncbi:MAG: cytochrome c biogenesis protein CcdA [Chloroflexota bacterium]
MSTQDISSSPSSSPEQTKERYIPVRALLIGGAALLLVLMLIVLGWGSSAAGTVASTSGGLLILAPAAFLAGLFSFLSPCTLPILPAYFAFTFQARRERVVVMTVSFFLGLATTMVVLGAASTALSQLLFANLRELIVIGGWLIVGFGVLSFLGKGFSGAKILDRPTASVAGSYVYGATFALGWTACIGPILGALMTLC